MSLHTTDLGTDDPQTADVTNGIAQGSSLQTQVQLLTQSVETLTNLLQTLLQSQQQPLQQEQLPPASNEPPLPVA